MLSLKVQVMTELVMHKGISLAKRENNSYSARNKIKKDCIPQEHSAFELKKTISSYRVQIRNGESSTKTSNNHKFLDNFM